MPVKVLKVRSFFGRKSTSDEAFISASFDDEENVWYPYMAVKQGDEWHMKVESKQHKYDTAETAKWAMGKTYPEIPIWIEDADDGEEIYQYPFWTTQMQEAADEMIAHTARLVAEAAERQELKAARMLQSAGKLPSNKELRGIDMTVRDAYRLYVQKEELIKVIKQRYPGLNQGERKTVELPLVAVNKDGIKGIQNMTATIKKALRKAQAWERDAYERGLINLEDTEGIDEQIG